MIFDYRTDCSCDARGTEAEVCDKETGQCLCKTGYGGPRCDQCIPGYNGYPDCKPCGCSEVGSASTVCDSSGKCPCLYNFAGRTCEQCSPGYYKYPDCLRMYSFYFVVWVCIKKKIIMYFKSDSKVFIYFFKIILHIYVISK